MLINYVFVYLVIDLLGYICKYRISGIKGPHLHVCYIRPGWILQLYGAATARHPECVVNIKMHRGLLH